MIDAARFVGSAREHGFDLYTGVPCSYLKPFINFVIDADGLDYVGAANEGDAVAIAAGAELGGRRGVVMLQNSGLGNTVNPLTSLTHTFRIPVLVIVTLRGEPGGAPDEPQHELMGRITSQLLESMEIPWAWFPEEDERYRARAAAGRRAHDGRAAPLRADHAQGQRSPIIRCRQSGSSAIFPPSAVPRLAPQASRTEMLRAVQVAGADDIVVATTGYTGRELYTRSTTGRTSSTWSARWAVPRASDSASRSRSRSGA